MNGHSLDPFRAGASLLHRLDARIKLALALAYILTVSLTPFGAWPVYILLLAIVLSAAALSELRLGWVFKRSLLATPFFLAALPLLFTLPGKTLLALPLGFTTLSLSQPGLERFAGIALKSWLAVQAAVLLAATTRFPDLLMALRALGLPRLLAAVIGLMWRYLFVLVDEALRLLRARTARSGSSPHGRRTGGSLFWRGRVAGGMAGSLFLRSLERSERIYAAMLGRGYNGEARPLPAASLTPPGQAVLAAGVSGLLALLALGLIFW